MRFKVFEIARHKGYLIHIGSRQHIGKQFEREVKKKIDMAMSAFVRSKESIHVVTITQDGDSKSGDNNIPELKRGKQYLIFALSLSVGDLFENPTRHELADREKTIGQSLDRLLEVMNPKPKISLVVLHDCTVELLSVEAYSNYLSWVEGRISSGKRKGEISLEELVQRADKALHEEHRQYLLD